MFRRILIASAVTAVALSALAAGGPATATQQTHGAYWQQTNGLRCALPVQGGDPGGRVIVNVHGGETRPVGVPFQTMTILTRLTTQKLVDDQWQNAYQSGVAQGNLDVVRQEGDHFFGPFMWPGFGNPDFPQHGGGSSDFWHLQGLHPHQAVPAGWASSSHSEDLER